MQVRMRCCNLPACVTLVALAAIALDCINKQMCEERLYIEKHSKLLMLEGTVNILIDSFCCV